MSHQILKELWKYENCRKEFFGYAPILKHAKLNILTFYFLDCLATFNAIFITKPTLVLFFYGLKWRGIPDIQVLPSIQTVLISCFISDHLYDIITYGVHRILHHKFFYKHIHKLHHEYKSPIAFSVFYLHPVEHFFMSNLPLGTGLLILRCHIATVWIYMISSMLSSTIAHAGYHLPFLNSPQLHDFHHMK